jgi:hypothetical protein
MLAKRHAFQVLFGMSVFTLTFTGCQNSLYLVNGQGKLFRVSPSQSGMNGPTATVESSIDTGLLSPEGLSSGGCANAVFVLDGSGNQIIEINPITGAHVPPSPIPGIVSSPPILPGLATSIRYDRLFYCRTDALGSCTLFSFALSNNTPTQVIDLGVQTAFRQPFTLTGLTLNPSDGMLYGTGRDMNDKWLFKVAVDGSSFSLIGKTDFQVNQNQTQPVGVEGLEFYRGILYGIDNTNTVPVSGPPNPFPHLIVVSSSTGQITGAYRTEFAAGQTNNLGTVMDVGSATLVPLYSEPLCWRNLTLIVVIPIVVVVLFLLFVLGRKRRHSVAARRLGF